MIQYLGLVLLLSCAAGASAAGEQSEVELWNAYIRPQYFQSRENVSDMTVVER